MLDGKSKPKEVAECWVIRSTINDDIVFTYQTYQGNVKKGLFNDYRYAEEALNKYISNPENYYICKVV